MRCTPLVAALTLVGGHALAQERYEVSGTTVAVYNIIGQVTLEPGTGPAVAIEVTRAGSNGAELTLERGPIGSRETLRVIYPSDDIRAPQDWYGGTDLRVREDGTFGDGNRRERGYREGRRVRISSHGEFDGRADLRIRVPPGQRIEIYLGAGKMSATNVKGNLHLDASSADVTTNKTSGELSIDVGSGDASVTDAEGNVNVDTGSGSVEVTGVRGDDLIIDTGSGRVNAGSVAVQTLDIDTGSGSVEVSGAAARSIRVDTGSGSVRCTLSSNPDRLDVDTGSGSVTLTLPATYSATVDIESSSGGVDIEFPVQTHRFSRDHVVGTIGDGRGTLRVDTGSGGVTIRKGTGG